MRDTCSVFPFKSIERWSNCVFYIKNGVNVLWLEISRTLSFSSVSFRSFGSFKSFRTISPFRRITAPRRWPNAWINNERERRILSTLPFRLSRLVAFSYWAKVKCFDKIPFESVKSIILKENYHFSHQFQIICLLSNLKRDKRFVCQAECRRRS